MRRRAAPIVSGIGRFPLHRATGSPAKVIVSANGYMEYRARDPGAARPPAP